MSATLWSGDNRAAFTPLARGLRPSSCAAARCGRRIKRRNQMKRYAPIMVAAFAVVPALAAAQATGGQPPAAGSPQPPAGAVRQDPAGKPAAKGGKGKHHRKRHRKHRGTSGGSVAPGSRSEAHPAAPAPGRPTQAGTPDAPGGSSPIVGGRAPGQVQMPPLPRKGDSLRPGIETRPTQRPPL